MTYEIIIILIKVIVPIILIGISVYFIYFRNPDKDHD